MSTGPASELRDRISDMFRGRRINVTEDRSVLHVALRAPEGRRLEVGHHHDLLMADLFAQSEAPAFGE